MKDFLRTRIGEIAITILTFLLCICFFTIVADDYGSLGFEMAGMQFSNYPHLDYFYLGIVGPLAWAYKLLYNTWPGINWMGISFVGFAFASLYLFLRAIKTVVFQNLPNIYLIRVVQVIFALFFIENISSLAYTRTSLIFCGIALFNLAFNRQMGPKRVFLNALLFILGMLIRPESSIGMITLVSAGYLIYRFNIIHLVKRFWLPLLATVTMYSVFAVDRMNTTIYVRKLEPEVEYKIMDKRYIDISSMKTPEDSVKYMAAINAMWIEPEILTTDYLRSLLLKGVDLSPEKASVVFMHTLSFYKYYLFIPFFLVSVILCCFYISNYRKSVFQIVIFIIFIFGLIYASDYNGLLIAERHFLNIQLIALLIILIYFFDGGGTYLQTKNRYLIAACTIFVLCGLAMTLVNCKKNNVVMADEIANSEKIMQKLESTYSHRIIVLTVNTMYMTGRHFSLKNNNYTNNTYLLYDYFTYSLMPEYARYLSTECHCDPYSAVDFFNWLDSEKALFISRPNRFDLLENYMRILHHDNVKFVSPVSLNKLANLDASNTKYWELRTVVVEK